jgi:predicted nuclease with TOPRIM domain
MEIDPTVLLGSIAAFATVGGAVLGYGELKTKVVSLMEKQSTERENNKEIFQRLNKIESRLDVDVEKLKVIEGNVTELAKEVHGHGNSINELGKTLSRMDEKLNILLKCHGTDGQ